MSFIKLKIFFILSVFSFLFSVEVYAIEIFNASERLEKYKNSTRPSKKDNEGSEEGESTSLSPSPSKTNKSEYIDVKTILV